jgi:hypothetical protein
MKLGMVVPALIEYELLRPAGFDPKQTSTPPRTEAVFDSSRFHSNIAIKQPSKIILEWQWKNSLIASANTIPILNEILASSTLQHWSQTFCDLLVLYMTMRELPASMSPVVTFTLS